MLTKQFISSKSLLVALIATVLALAGCENFEERPEGALTVEEVLKTPEDVQRALTAAYDVLRSGNFMGGQAWHLGDLMTDHFDEINIRRNGDWAAHYSRTTDIFLGTTRGFASDGYQVANRANFVLENIDLVEGIPADRRAQIIAECKALRALVHFEEVRIFAHPYGYTADNSHPGMPVRIRQSIDTVARASVGALYAQVIQDFREAILDLPDVHPVATRGYFTSWGAKAYLATVYFQMNQYQEAFDLANDVIQNGPFQLDSLNARFGASAGFSSGSTEGIFELVSDNNLGNNSGAFIRDNYRPIVGNNNIPNISYSASFYARATADPSDLRGQQWYDVVSGDRDIYISNKFEYGNVGMYVPLVHLTELKLIRAECAAELGTNLGVATSDLNDILRRAGLPELGSGLPANNLIAEARKQRELEMVSEGNRLHEFKRVAVATVNGTTKLGGPLTIRGADWDCPALIAQLPDSELNGNPNVTPNPDTEIGCN